MPVTAAKIDQLRAELVDGLGEKSELWLYAARRDIELARAGGLVTAADYHNLIGIVFARLGQWARAIQHGRKAVELDDDPTFAFNLGTTLGASGEPRAALEVFQSEALADEVRSQISTANCHLDLGNWRTARRLYRAAAERAELDDHEHLYRLFQCAERLGLYEDAVRLFARFLAVARQAGAVDDAERDPLAFVLAAPLESYRELGGEVYPIIAVHTLALRRGTSLFPPEREPGGPDASANEAVLDEWSDLRAEANAAVMDGE